MASKPLTLAIIGCGSIGTSIASGVLDASHSATVKTPFQIKRVIATVSSDVSLERVSTALKSHADKLDIRLQSQNSQALDQADVVVLAVKPLKWHDVLNVPGAREALRGKLLISAIAGVSTSVLDQAINGGASDTSPSGCQVVRVMPNMAAQIRQSMTLGTTIPGQVSQKNMKITEWIFHRIGEFQLIPEGNFDIAGVLVGCSGSLMMLAIDGLLDAAVAEGMKRSEAQSLAVNSAVGMLGLLSDKGGLGHPSLTREKVASPGGSSIQALLELEERGVRSAYTAAIMKASAKSREMSKI